MGMIKNYLLSVICSCSEHEFGQDAVEYAVSMGLVKLTGNLNDDVAAIMKDYDDIVENYRKQLASNEAALLLSYGPLLEEITRAGADPDDRWRDRQLFPREETA